MTADEARHGPFDKPPHDASVVKCPDCDRHSPLAELREGEVSCDSCGDHSAILCPRCDCYIDSVTGDFWTVVS